MATRDTGQPPSGITRRDFLKTAAAATAVAGCGLEIAFDPERAAAYEADTTNYDVKFTTCPYCSASCGQRVVTAKTGPNTGRVVDIYGDFESVYNSGGLCAKGAGTLQLVNNPRRVGAWAADDQVLARYSGTHPVNPTFLANTTTYPNGVAYRRIGNGAWSPMALDTALDEIAGGVTVGAAVNPGLVGARDAAAPISAANYYNSKGVTFFGSSHMNNEPNYVYRKMIANFGTSNVEHQARI